MSTCNECRWWRQRDKAVGNGECRRNPPAVLNIPTGTFLGGSPQTRVQARWPDVSFDDWCGEFSRKPDASRAQLGPGYVTEPVDWTRKTT